MATKIISQLVRAAVVSADDATPKMFLFGLFGIVGHPLYYLIWGYILPQPYENLSLRIAAMLIAVPALFVAQWPPTARRYLPIYWYLLIMLAAPFFFTFMLLENGVNTVWSGSFIIAIAIVFLTCDLVSGILILGAGIATAVSVYLSVTSAPLPWERLVEQAPVYFFTIATIAIFNLEGARQQRAKIAAAMALGSHIAHELRTPLATIQAASNMIESRLPKLLSELRAAPAVPLEVDRDTAMLIRNAPQVIASEVDYAFMVIDLALSNTGLRAFGGAELQAMDIAPAIRSAIQRFPFKEQAQKSWIHVEIDGDSSVNAIPVLIEHLIFNLLKNSIYAIQAAGRGSCGEIRIRLAVDRYRKSLYLRDNGQGIPTALLPRVFDPFFSTRTNGTGLGLHFCHSVMSRVGGAIRCRSVPGEFTEIVLEFPVEQ